MLWGGLLLSQVYAGRFNMSYLYGSGSYEQLVERTGGSIQEVAPSYFDLTADGNLQMNPVDTAFVASMHRQGVKVVPFLSNHWSRSKGRNALANLESLTDQLAEAIQKYQLDGVNVDIENVTEVDREHYTQLVKRLREKLGDNRVIAVAVAANPHDWKTGWHGSYDYAGLAQYADYLMLMTYDEHYEGGPAGPVASISFVEQSIQYALSQVSPDKVVLGIPFFGRYWKEGASYGGYGITLNQVESLLSRYSHTVTYDKGSESVEAKVTIQAKDTKMTINGKKLEEGTYTIWYENEVSISAKLALVNQYHLKGTGSWSLGQEPADTWRYYDAQLNLGYQEETPSTPVEEAPSQIPGTWAEKAIEQVKEKGWMQGKTETEFYPKDALTRAEFATIMSRILQLEQYHSKKELPYGDVKGHWASEAIRMVTACGYMRGYENGTFQPNQTITREEVATVFATRNWNTISSGNTVNTMSTISNIAMFSFSDVSASRWSYQAIQKVTQMGVMEGYENGLFEPKKTISREEMAVVLSRIFF